MRNIYICCCVFLVTLSSYGQSSKYFWLGTNRAVSDKLKKEILNDVRSQTGCRETTQPFLNIGIDYIYKVICDSADYTKIIGFAKQHEGVTYAEPCQIYRLLSVPNDTILLQWYLAKVNAIKAWDLPATGQSTIAVIDDGVYLNHPDLLGNIHHNTGEIRGNGKDDDSNGFIDDYFGYDVASGDTDVNPPSGISGSYMYHGTHVSGIAAGVTDNQLGLASISRNRAGIIPVKASTLPLVLTHAEEGIAYALSLKPNILCLSFGGTDTANYSTLRILLKAATDSGTIIIAAAGNEGNETPVYPAAYPFVWAVGATGKGDQVASYSSYGSYIDLMAPGDSIYSLMPNGLWASYKSGTSMSAPMVAAAAAYLIGVNPAFSWSKVMQCLVQTADPIDAINDPKYSGKTGSGRLNLERAAWCARNNSVFSPDANLPLIYTYPNPADEGIIIDLKQCISEMRNLIVYDMSGRQIKQIRSAQSLVYIYTSDLLSGIYILKISRDDEERVIKFSVSR